MSFQLTPAQKMATARILATKQAPFLQRGLLALTPIEDSTVLSGDTPTFGVTEDMVLRWHPEALAKWTPEQTAAVLLHEISHVLRDHADRFRSLKAPDDQGLWNMAGDFEINDDLIAMGLELPGDPCLPSKEGWDDGLPAEGYYALLKAKQKQGRGSAKPGGGCCAGHCGSGAGNPLPGDPPPGTKKIKGSSSGNAKGAGRSQADIQRVKLQVAEDIKQASSQGRGNVPSGWVQWADNFIKPAKVRWQDKLARIIRGVVSNKAGLKDYSYMRPSRRQGAYGFGMGFPILPALCGFTPRIAVGVDTSGSMGADGISRAASELVAILHTVAGDVDYIACDCSVHVQTKVRSGQDLSKLFTGGGGTSFIPVFEAVSKMKPKPSVFIFVTDGDGEAPPEPPKGVSVIWVLCGAYRRDPGVSYGEKIHIDD